MYRECFFKFYILICVFACGLNSQISGYNTTSAIFKYVEVTLEVKERFINSLRLNNTVDESSNETMNLAFTYQLKGSDKIVNNQSFLGVSIIEPLSNITIRVNSTNFVAFNITGQAAGSLYLGIISQDIRFKVLKSVYCHVDIIRSHGLKILGDVIGWIYFVAWTVSFYPQVILNIRNKSVVGLNFDFLIYNWIGFFSYSVFNVGLYWLNPIKDLFKQIHPRSVNPVQLNDVIFSLHAILIVTIQLVQCCIYERKDQKISKFCYGLASCMILYIIIIASVAGFGVKTFTWLDFVYYISYLKLFITLIKYIPQALMNYRRKSTIGWSIGNIFLDFTGGFLSIVQMIILSHNNDDWKSFFTDPTKFGLGLFSILFDILFMVQHYILYRGASHETYEIFDNDELNSQNLTN